MDPKNIVNKIHECLKDFNDNLQQHNAQRKVLVMHPSVILLIKDHIVPQSTPKLGTFYRFNDSIDCFIFFGLPKFHVASMTMKQFEDLVNPIENENQFFNKVPVY